MKKSLFKPLLNGKWQKMMYLSIMLTAFLSIVFGQNGFAQDVNSGFIGQNYWMPKFTQCNGTVINGNIDDVWDDVTKMDLEIVRIGGNAYSCYLGTSVFGSWVEKIESAGAIPAMQFSPSWTSAQRDELLSYFVSNGKDLKYFFIGNEPDLGNTSVSVNTIISYFIEIGKQIRSYYPNAILIGPAYANFYESFMSSHYYTFIDGLKDQLDDNGKYLLNVFDFHTYNSSFASNGTAIFDLSTLKSKMQPLIAKIAEVNASRPADEQLSWSISEFNTTYNNTQLNVSGTNYLVPSTHKTYSFYAGQFFAQVYGYAMEEKAFAVMPWSVHEGGGARGSGDLGIFDGSGPFYPRSTYYHTQMLGNNLKENFITSSSSKDDVELVAMADASGVTVMVMNTQENAYGLTLNLNNSGVGSDLLVNVEAGISKEIQDYITPQTTITYVFDATGVLVKKITYSKAHADIKQAPTVTTQLSGSLIPGKVEAENFTAMMGVMNKPSNDEDNSNQVYAINLNDYIDYQLDVLKKGEYAVDFRIAAPVGMKGQSFDIMLGDQLIKKVVISEAEGAQKWLNIQDTLTLVAGVQTIRIQSNCNNFQMNWMVFTYIPELPVMSFTTPAEGFVKDWGTTLPVNVAATHSNGISNVQLYLDGVLVRQENLAPYDWGSNDEALTYISPGSHVLKAVATANSEEVNEAFLNLTVVGTEYPRLSFTSPTDGASFSNGSTVYVNVSAVHSQGLSNVKLYLNDQFIRQEGVAPYEWGLSGQNDVLLSNMAAGSYVLKAVVTANTGVTAEASIAISVEAAPDPFTLSYFHLIDKLTNDYMRPTAGSSTAYITQYEQTTVPTSYSYQWEFRTAPETGYYHIVNRWTGKAIQPEAASSAEEVKLFQVDLDATSQYNTEVQWAIEPSNESGYYWIKNRNSGKYIRPQYGTNGTGVYIVQNTLNASFSSYKWKLSAYSLKSAMINSESEVGIQPENIKVFPNPASKYFILNGISNYETVNVISQTGQRVKQIKINRVNELQVDISDLRTGIYLIQVVNSTSSETQRLMVK